MKKRGMLELTRPRAREAQWAPGHLGRGWC